MYGYSRQEGPPFRPSLRFKSCEAKKFCETVGPVDHEWVFSDSVPCLRKQAMNITEEWTQYLAYYKKSARRVDGAQIPFHIPCLSWQSNERDRIQQGEGEKGQNFTPETHPHQMMNEIPFSSQGPKRGNAQFLQDAGRNAAHFGKFKPGYFMYVGPGSEETWKLGKYTDNPKGK